LIHPSAQAQRLQLAERLAREGRVPGVLICNPSGKTEWLLGDKRIVIPDDAAKFLPHPAEIKEQLARDIAGLCCQKFAGDIVLLGWSPGKPAATFVNEHGSHAGP
jgi:hypothetical protein